MMPGGRPDRTQNENGVTPGVTPYRRT